MNDFAITAWCASGLLIHIYVWGFYLGALTFKGPGIPLFILTIPHSLAFGPLMALIYAGCIALMGGKP